MEEERTETMKIKATILILTLLLILLLPIMGMGEVVKPIDLQPGIYLIGKDVPGGEWEFRFHNIKDVSNISVVEIGIGSRLNAEKTGVDVGGERYANLFLMMEWKENPRIKMYLFPGDYLVIKYNMVTLFAVEE